MSIKKRTSSVRFKIITIITLSVVFLSLFIYFVSTRIFRESYNTIEQNQAIQNVKRVSDMVDNTLAQLNIRLIDWAFWDDSYQFIKDGNKAYIESNLGNSSISNIKINTMLFAGINHEIVYAKSINYNTKENIPSDNIEEHVRSHEELTTPTNNKSSMQGIILLPEGPMLITTSPILTSEAKGPVRGTLIFGKYFDENLIGDIGKLTHLTINIYKYDDIFLPPEIANVKAKLTKNNTFFTSPISNNIIAGYTILKDIHGEPALILRVETQREVYFQGLHTLNSFLIISIIAILLFGIIIIIFIETFFVFRFSRLSREVNQIGETKDFKGRVTEGRTDGIGELAITINSMLDKLSIALETKEQSNNIILASDKKLSEKLQELEKVNQLMIDRELKMVELKKEINDLKK